MTVHKVEGGDTQLKLRDTLVVEEPLTIVWQGSDGPSQRLSATMRTPGEDYELAAGLLFSEGLLKHQGEIEVLSFCASGAPNELNRLRAQLRISLSVGESRLAYRPSSGTPQSACGMCSTDQLANPKGLLRWAAAARPPDGETLTPDHRLLQRALGHLGTHAPTFAATGASHAVVVVDEQGNLLVAAEDVGRHNACDKALGSLLLATRPSSDGPFTLPPGSGILFSSRLSFELAAKAARAGAAWMASVGAPTLLAIELAQLCGLPTLGFVSSDRHNIYVEAPSKTKSS